jgi:hypothetical protein
MTTRQVLILTSFFLLITIKVVGQVDSSDYNDRYRNKIDSLSQIIDKRNPKYLNCNIFTDSLAGEKIISIKKQVYKGISKYSLKTNRTGTRMDIKLVELYLYHDILIQATVFYADDKHDFWKTFYFKDNLNFYMIATRGMRMSLDEKGEEYIDVVKKIVSTEIIK